jgi:translation initiation factor 6 (eIF-6)
MARNLFAYEDMLRNPLWTGVSVEIVDLNYESGGTQIVYNDSSAVVEDNLEAVADSTKQR